MARQKSRAELLSSLLRAEKDAQALRLFVQKLAQTQLPALDGWYFVQSPRGYCGFLIHLQGGQFHAYDVAIGTEEYRLLGAALYRLADEQNLFHSYVQAIAEAGAFRNQYIGGFGS